MRLIIPELLCTFWYRFVPRHLATKSKTLQALITLTSSIRTILTSGNCVGRVRVGVDDTQGDFDGVESMDEKENGVGVAGLDAVDTDEGVRGADE